MLGHLTTPRDHDDARAHVRDFVKAVSDGGPGGSYGLSRGRFVVGGWVNAVVIRKGASQAERLRAALEFTEHHGYGPYGYWTDNVTGRTWLDVVIATDDWQTAVRWADQHGELAVYDRQEDEVTYV